MSAAASENPICISRPEPPSASAEALGDPAEPHPDEPGAPADTPQRRIPHEAGDGEPAD